MRWLTFSNRRYTGTSRRSPFFESTVDGTVDESSLEARRAYPDDNLVSAVDVLAILLFLSLVSVLTS